MSATYFFRHQALGVDSARPMASAPGNAELAAFAVEMEERFGATHPKTGEPYWIKVLEVENGETRTVAGLCGGAPVDGAHADAHAAGHCPLREGEIVVERTATDVPGGPGLGKVTIHGVGYVKNPE